MKRILQQLWNSSSADYYGAQRMASVPCDDVDARLLSLEKFTLSEFISHLESQVRHEGAFARLLDSYRVTREFPDLSNFRLGPNMFDRIPMDWMICINRGAPSRESQLIGHGIATRIEWSGNASDLPMGWQGSVREAFQNSAGQRRRCNTLVGLFVKVEDEYRGHQWAERILRDMKRIGQSSGMTSLIIPLRLPSHYEREYAEVSIEQLANLRRDDGQYFDHWLRLHVRLGAEIIGCSSRSHQHAMNLDDFVRQFECPELGQTGYHLVARNDEWYRAFVDLERDVAFINQGCVWVRHPML
jgi:hypothetical protein